MIFEDECRLVNVQQNCTCAPGELATGALPRGAVVENDDLNVYLQGIKRRLG